jgi:hypothetical protein
MKHDINKNVTDWHQTEPLDIISDILKGKEMIEESSIQNKYGWIGYECFDKNGKYLGWCIEVAPMEFLIVNIFYMALNGTVLGRSFKTIFEDGKIFKVDYNYFKFSSGA